MPYLLYYSLRNNGHYQTRMVLAEKTNVKAKDGPKHNTVTTNGNKTEAAVQTLKNQQDDQQLAEVHVHEQNKLLMENHNNGDKAK